ncbi:hypothetical protein [Microbispora bryophytorum]|uniref:hypothetical protein n=1 Tax=Microbispora bryophytorum TaxID=1460882 RepID=UPI0033E79C17
MTHQSTRQSDRVGPASGNMFVAGQQFWLGRDRAGVVVTFWADTDVIQLAGCRGEDQEFPLAPVERRPDQARHQWGRAATRPSAEPVTVQRVASNSGVIMVVGQTVVLGRIHARAIVTVQVSDTTLTIELSDDTRGTAAPPLNPSAASKRPSPARPVMFLRAPVQRVVGQNFQSCRGTRQHSINGHPNPCASSVLYLNIQPNV